MKQEYKPYPKGSLEEVEKKLDSKSNKLLQEFLTSNVNASLTTQQKIKTGLLKWFDMYEKQLWIKPTQNEINVLVGIMKRSGVSVNSLNKDFQYIRKFLNWKFKDYELTENIVQGARVNEERLNEDSLLTNEEREEIIRGEENLRWKTIWSIFDESGLRSSELINLKVGNCKFGDMGITIISIYSKKTKTFRKVPLKSSTKLIKDWEQQYPYPNMTNEDYLFPSLQDRQTPMTLSTINMALNRVVKKVGIRKNIYPYIFRHTRATFLYLKSGLPTKTVETLMGHKNMYQRYAHLSKETAVRQMIEKVHNIKEIDDDRKHKLEKQIEEMKKDIEFLNNQFNTADKNGVSYIINPRTITPNKLKLINNLQEEQ